MHRAQPHIVPQLLRGLVLRPETFDALEVKAKLWSKKIAWPKGSEIRAILPLPPLLQILDWLVSHNLCSWLQHLMPMPRGTYAGGVRGTQVARCRGWSVFAAGEGD